MPVETGRYFIINCRTDGQNLAYLRNANAGEPLRARSQHPVDELKRDQVWVHLIVVKLFDDVELINAANWKWEVTNHKNGHHSIQNVAYKNYAESGDRPPVGADVTGEEPGDEFRYMWRIEETNVEGKYTISTITSTSRRFLGWGLADNQQRTPIALGDVSTDPGNQWMFKAVGTEEPDIQDQDSDNPNTSDNHNARAAGNDKDRVSHVLSGQVNAIDPTDFPQHVSGQPVMGNMDERIRRELERLEEHVVTSAFHNSSERVNPPRCHPNTRVAILDQIYNWILMDHLIRQTWIMWMVGTAGAGKSAIMQSIADRCERERIPLASFFFLRTDATRNSLERFFATLIYQLIQKIPQARNDILTIIEQDPLIFKTSFESQLQQLIIDPLRRVRAHFQGFFVLLIDGLDECLNLTHQSELIKLLGSVSRSGSLSYFLSPAVVSNLVLNIPLDTSDIEQSADDIRRFLEDKFSDLKENHLFNNDLPADWPLPSIVKEIVDKSSGQFIFASVVIKYISSPDANPAHQLEVVRGIRPRGPSDNPFAHLDALYAHIFSQVGRETLDKVLDIIAFSIAIKQPYVYPILAACQIKTRELGILFVKLRAIIQCGDSELTFLHASLPDFLLDKHRSGEYSIDLEHYRTKLMCMLLKRDPPILDPLSGLLVHYLMLRETSRLDAVLYLFDRAPPSGVKVSKELHSAFMNFKFTFYSATFMSFRSNKYDVVPTILRHVDQLDFRDQGKAYRQVVRTFAAEYAKYWTSFNDGEKTHIVQEAPDLVAHIKKIRRVSILHKIIQYLRRRPVIQKGI